MHSMDLRGAKILIVDDVPTNLDILCRALEAEGYNVLVATSGEAALKAGMRAKPDLILLDVMLGDLDGFEICQRLKQHLNTRDIPVIFLSARDEPESVAKGFKAGGVAYIRKPFLKEEVLVCMRIHLERMRLARELAELKAARASG